jgi:hypothetical protein
MTIPVYINILMRRGIKTKAKVRNQAKGKKVAGPKNQRKTRAGKGKRKKGPGDEESRAGGDRER